jgi:hypothetical protein
MAIYRVHDTNIQYFGCPRSGLDVSVQISWMEWKPNSSASLERCSNWRPLRCVLSIGLFGVLAANSAMTAFLSTVSRMNYPGGEAMTQLHAIVDAPKGTDQILASAYTEMRLVLKIRSFPSGSFHRRPCSPVWRLIVHARMLGHGWALRGRTAS